MSDQSIVLPGRAVAIKVHLRFLEHTPHEVDPGKHLHLKYDSLIGVPYVPGNHTSPTTRSVFQRANAILSIGTVYTLRERTVPSCEELDQE